ncbi:3-hydroxyacyl-CoA dehydrogenase family protein [Thermaerobacillus caldiproteolyticus]|uniref:3-hydroxybutyryl-CoA dehydrogenase n=1 Tax=Thermaerobacillus caldiproteolyticus TaxID=247480 RepID=A0A7V9Z588_9BACL|nr:3-hydroxyacyl-CoA dehydrogenase family protein [Anoxybacillus caldiproteolyticus]MBA2874198.1 3-hydroxybutyryl-CoA dehydrogenase [Anoxybacillus caldiproteolyticus]QPA31864.1 3-hydroxyacyl-CoA dehydrogenase family protein [Anoxybacillus caldiproteolyticus]
MTIQTIAVIGAGSMGHQIAMLCALGGYATKLQDIHEHALTKAKATLEDIMNKWVNKGKITEEKKEAAFSRLSFTTSLEEAVKEADFVIEAVVEKLDVKREVFAQLDRFAPAHAILATNSSTIVNSLIADVTNRTDKVINMHFFFPPLVMDCIEVVMSEQTSDETAHITMDVCKQINRTGVLLRREISGFVANRILGALQREAVALYEKGIADFKDIDLICKKALNHPIGPFELMDLSGIDVVYYVMQQRYAETGDPEDRPFACIEEKVKQGHLGRKTGRGWYVYEKQPLNRS